MYTHKSWTLLAFALPLLVQADRAHAQCDPLLNLPITGDFEITLDPDDPPHLLYVTNQGDSPALLPSDHNIRVAQLDGVDGLLRKGPSLIATNYTGNQDLNGPEFLTSLPAFPFGPRTVGVLYSGPYGVHAAFRLPHTAWDAFDTDVAGNPILLLRPPALPGTTIGSYPGPDPADGRGYGSFHGTCGYPLKPGSFCYGDVDASVLTPVVAFALAEGLVDVNTVAHPTLPRVVMVSACTAAGGPCSLYRGTIDGAGGMIAVPAAPGNTAHFEWVASLNANELRRQTLSGGVIPTTGTVMWAVAEINAGGALEDNIKIFSEDTTGALHRRHVVLLASKVEHFRMVEGDTELYLDYQVRDVAARQGSYEVGMDETAAGTFGFSRRDHYYLGDPHGVELVYLPGAAPAGRLAYYLGHSWLGSNVITRCWL